MAATNGAGTPMQDGELSIKPPSDIVIPPQGVREKIIKTADFINRKGEDMEQTIRNRSGKDPKFGFLNRDDAYYVYFKWYLEQLKLGLGPAACGAGAQSARDNKPKGPVEPVQFRFSARMPNISAKDLEVLKLTALWTAKNGENWLKELRNREQGNFQFEFLRANHSFNTFFKAIVEQYRILLFEEQTVESRIEELQRNIQNRFHILGRAKQRAEYTTYVSQQKEKEEKKAEEEKKEYASIDWNDFSVIATVTFDEADDAAELPPPTTLNDLQSRSLEQKAEVSLSRRLDEAAPDEQTYYNVSQHTPGPVSYQGFPPPHMPMQQPVHPIYQPPPVSMSIDYRPRPQSSREEEEARNAREKQAEQDRAARAQAAAKGAPGTMRIREDYVPRAAAKKANVSMQVCPNCGQQIPADEIADHVRIELLDPRWKEQKEKADARYSSTMNHAEVANNLKRFASARDDIYDGVSGMPITEEEAARRKRAALSYDGQPDPAKDAARIQEMQSMNVQEQLRRIQERHGAK